MRRIIRDQLCLVRLLISLLSFLVESKKITIQNSPSIDIEKLVSKSASPCIPKSTADSMKSSPNCIKASPVKRSSKKKDTLKVSKLRIQTERMSSFGMEQLFKEDENIDKTVNNDVVKEQSVEANANTELISVEPVCENSLIDVAGESSILLQECCEPMNCLSSSVKKSNSPCLLTPVIDSPSIMNLKTEVMKPNIGIIVNYVIHHGSK